MIDQLFPFRIDKAEIKDGEVHFHTFHVEPEVDVYLKGMRITNDEFDAMVGDIKTSMDKLSIPQREKRDMLAVVETTRKQIVEQ